MRLVASGDSWTWGAELVDPIEEPVPIITLPGGGFDRQYKPINMEYRFKHRYINQFANLINADELVDLSRCSYSNDAIVRTLIDWLVQEGYLSGRDTSDLFVTIGWTSPERREFFHKEQWGDTNWLEFGPWSADKDHGKEGINKFIRYYIEEFWNIGEYIHRWIRQLWQTELLLKHYKIKYVMHQAFYHDHDKVIHQWNDESYKKDIAKNITLADKRLWDSLDSIRFMHKDSPTTGTMHHYIINQVDNSSDVFVVMHPNHHGHKLWAQHMYEYCKGYNLL